jgi:hypothetical protein
MSDINSLIYTFDVKVTTKAPNGTSVTVTVVVKVISQTLALAEKKLERLISLDQKRWGTYTYKPTMIEEIQA